jgi:hypothetical protein
LVSLSASLSRPKKLPGEEAGAKAGEHENAGWISSGTEDKDRSKASLLTGSSRH